MRISRKASVLLITYTSAALLTLSGIAYENHIKAEEYRREIYTTYSYAFSELSDCITGISRSLQKALYSSSPSMLSSICSDVYAKTSSASSALSSLPYADRELEHTAAFIAKTGDYAYFLMRNISGGNEYSEKDRESLSSLSKSAAKVAAELDELSAQLLSGQYSIYELERLQDVLSSGEDSMLDTGLAGGVKRMETEFSEIPSLIYDGPFSSHIGQRYPKLLDGSDEISEEDAVKIASDFTGISVEDLYYDHTRDTDVPVYVISGKGNDITAEITRSGGKTLYFRKMKITGAPVLSDEDAVKVAARFLESRGYDSMKATYWSDNGNEVTVNFAYDLNGTMCYTDLIKVTVALDAGDIISFESMNYIMNHAKRTLPEINTPAEEAEKTITPSLKVLSRGTAVIPTNGKNEVFCHEFKCEDPDGKHCIIYANAETGIEEKILILLEDENGTLVI